MLKYGTDQLKKNQDWFTVIGQMKKRYIFFKNTKYIKETSKNKLFVLHKCLFYPFCRPSY